MKNKQIYKVDHPTIKEIRIGDKFITEDGSIAIFTRLWGDKFNKVVTYPFYFKLINNNAEILYDIKLGRGEYSDGMQIKGRYISLKDKLDLLKSV